MNPVAVIPSQVSQKEENKYCILTHVHGVWKDSTDGTYLQGRSGQTWWADLWTQWRRERVGRIKSSMHPFYPSVLSQSTKFELPSSYSKFVTGYPFYMWQCVFFHATLNSSHPLPPPLCPQVCSPSLSTAALQIGSISTIFPDSMYMC